MRPWCAGTISPAGSFDMSFVRHDDEVAYICCLYGLFRKYRERSIEEEDSGWLSLCCFNAPYHKFYLVRDGADWYRELEFERWQCLNMK